MKKRKKSLSVKKIFWSGSGFEPRIQDVTSLNSSLLQLKIDHWRKNSAFLKYWYSSERDHFLIDLTASLNKIAILWVIYLSTRWDQDKGLISGDGFIGAKVCGPQGSGESSLKEFRRRKLMAGR